MNRTAKSTGETQAPPAGLAGWLMEAARLLWSRNSAQCVRTRERQMKLIETLSLGGRKQLLLVQCGGEDFLVGIGEHSVETIVRVACAAGQNAAEEQRTCC